MVDARAPDDTTNTAPVPSRTALLAGYFVLYVVWGSTYLAMRIAADTLPPFLLASSRFVIAGSVLFGYAVARGEGWQQPKEWKRAAVVALFLLVGGNGSVVWAVQRVPSGVAALLVASTPLWLAVFSRERVTRRVVLGFALGFLGIGILVGPSAIGSGRVDPAGAAMLLLASVSWAIGSLVQRAGRATSSAAASGMQMLIGSVFLFTVSSLAGERLHVDAISSRSIAALAYLTVFGSLIGFTTYAWLLKHQPASRVSTYAYINPLVAVALGSFIAAEPVSPRVLLAAAVIVGGVVSILASPTSPSGTRVETGEP